MELRRFLLRSMATLVVLGVASCGGGSVPGKGSSNNELQSSLTLDLAPYLVVDLTSGAISGAITISDLATNPLYRSTNMVFVHVPAGTTTIGAATGALGAGYDPVASSVAIPQFYLAAFETTQAQWQAIAGTTPWTSLSVIPSGATGSLATTPDAPAFGISYDDVRVALQAYTTGKVFSLRVPTGSEWEHACRGGTTTAFWWGNNPNDAAAANPNAVVLETGAAAVTGPLAVGQKQPNPYGLYDIQGNVWELTHTGLTTNVRGGSWRDPLVQARASQVTALDRATRHALVGVRLVLVP